MENAVKRAVSILIVLLVATATLAVPETAFARDPSPKLRYRDTEIVSGEPGEDPHLRVLPIEPVNPISIDVLFTSTACEDGGVDISGGSAKSGRGLGFRMDRARYLIFQMWLWTQRR